MVAFKAERSGSTHECVLHRLQLLDLLARFRLAERFDIPSRIRRVLLLFEHLDEAFLLVGSGFVTCVSAALDF